MPRRASGAPPRLLLATAAEAEASAILRGLGSAPTAIEPWCALPVAPRVDVLLTGVGKVSAAGALARALDPARHAAVVNLGAAGALPGAAGFAADLLDVVLASSSLLADEGLATPEGFQSLAAMGFPPAGGTRDTASEDAMSVASDPALAAALKPLADRVGDIATVSTCSGEDACARDLAQRTGAIAEAMEGAALAFTIRRLINSGQAPAALAFAELRVISNTTGDRPRQTWRLREALDRLADLGPNVRERALAVVDSDRPGG